MSDLWVFDLDGTLYDDKLAHAQWQRLVTVYIARRFNLPDKEADLFLRRLKQKWQTPFSLVAWKREYNSGVEELIQETYLRIDLAVCEIASPDVERRRALEVLSERKIVFSNSPRGHIEQVLHYGGLLDLFSGTIGMQELGYCAKPEQRAFEIVEELYPDFDRIFFCDDDEKNLAVARERGWKTFWFAPGSADRVRDGHQVVRSFAELR